MEIVTYVIDGGLTHKDSMGTVETLSRGSVQYMSAGTGITHSEYNASKTDMLRFLQIWIVPDKKGYTPRYGSKRFTLEDRHNKIQHLVGNDLQITSEAVIPIHQDANFYVSELDEGHKVSFVANPSRQIYVVCIEGALSFTTEKHGKEDMAIRDGLQIINNQNQSVTLQIENTASGTSHFLMVEMALSE